MHLKVDISDDDNLINDLIASAVAWAEEYTNRQLMPATWYLYCDSLPHDILIQRCPVTAISSITYYDTDNESQTLSTTLYDADIISEPARVSEAYGQTYPATYERFNAVTIEFTAGYADADTVPAPIKQALLLMIEHDYDNRGDEGHRMYPKAILRLLDMYRLF